MALNLPSAAIISANTQNSGTAWLLLLEINLTLDDGTAESIKICHNNEAVIWNGATWAAYPFNISDNKADNKGSLSNITIEVSNATRELEYYLEHSAGGTGADVILYVVRADDLSESAADLEEHFIIKSTSLNENNITFSLGNAYNANQRRPYRRYMKNSCPFKYKGVECGANSNLTSCPHTLSACRERNNAERFGGFPGIPQGGTYV